jgi:hypothetical protein
MKTDREMAIKALTKSSPSVLPHQIKLRDFLFFRQCSFFNVCKGPYPADLTPNARAKRLLGWQPVRFWRRD